MIQDVFRAFLATYPPDSRGKLEPRTWSDQNTKTLVGCVPPNFTDFIREIARPSHGSGILRFVLPEGELSLKQWNSSGGWAGDWKQWRTRLVVFAYDWLGRQIGFDRGRMKNGEPLIAMLEPGTGELLEIPATFSTYITAEVIEAADAALATKFYVQWKKSGGRAPRVGECIGYRQPLFMGGGDTVDNLEVSDLRVYLSLCGQLVSKVG